MGGTHTLSWQELRACRFQLSLASVLARDPPLAWLPAPRAEPQLTCGPQVTRRRNQRCESLLSGWSDIPPPPHPIKQAGTGVTPLQEGRDRAQFPTAPLGADSSRHPDLCDERVGSGFHRKSSRPPLALTEAAGVAKPCGCGSLS